MSTNRKQITTQTTIENLAAELKKSFAKKSELTPISNAAAAAIKSLAVDGNTVNFYTSTDKTGAAAFTVDFPKELFLDQANTSFVPSFTWSNDTYPGSTDPKLDGKPVFVLAVKGADGSEDTVTYSFVNMAALVDTYTAKTDGKDASTTVEISGYKVEVKVNISKEDGNILELKSDGLYVPTPEETDISGKADKVASATSGNFAGLDGNGNLTDSGKNASDFVAAEEGKRLITDTEADKLDGISAGANKVTASATNGHINIDGVDTTVYTEPENVLHESDITDYTPEEIAALLADDE